MRPFYFFSIISTALIFSGFSSIYKTPINADSFVKFVIKNASVNVNGHFNSFYTTIKFNKGNIPASIFNGVINVSSIDTDIKKRDEHLKKADYFDASKHTGIVFKSIAVASANANTLKVTGNLTIKATTKQIVLNVNYTTLGDNTIFTSKLNLNRTDYNIGGKSMLMSDDVSIDLKFSVKSGDLK